MVFAQPTWIEGTIYFALWVAVPCIIGLVLMGIGAMRHQSDYHKGTIPFTIGMIVLVIGVIGGGPMAHVGWHYQYEVPSVQEKVITVDDWQPTFGKYWGDVDGADDLMLKTTDGELFGTEENLLFQKFATRDILDQLKPNGTYKIKYYGWREGFNNGVPNILAVEQVINESKSPAHHDISNYMNKRSVIIDNGDLR